MLAIVAGMVQASPQKFSSKVSVGVCLAEETTFQGLTETQKKSARWRNRAVMQVLGRSS